jgi:hypothetical protein
LIKTEVNGSGKQESLFQKLKAEEAMVSYTDKRERQLRKERTTEILLKDKIGVVTSNKKLAYIVRYRTERESKNDNFHKTCNF